MLHVFRNITLSSFDSLWLLKANSGKLYSAPAFIETSLHVSNLVWRNSYGTKFCVNSTFPGPFASLAQSFFYYRPLSLLNGRKNISNITMEKLKQFPKLSYYLIIEKDCNNFLTFTCILRHFGITYSCVQQHASERNYNYVSVTLLQQSPTYCQSIKEPLPVSSRFKQLFVQTLQSPRKLINLTALTYGNFLSVYFWKRYL
jgi:hypothetical protein